jgi:RNA polymerase sigma-70 factor, ECF subfamily
MCDTRVVATDTVSPSDEAAFAAARGRLFGIAYRMLGSASDAEDVVQEAWIRWQQADRAEVRDPTAFLVTVTTRLAINALSSARVRRETYIGPWLPEPIDTSADPALGAERAEALDLAVMTVLERLSPTERAAFVLREAFDYPHREVARVLDVGEANARQISARARRHVERESGDPVAPEERLRLLEAIIDAAREGDVVGLEQLLAADVVFTSDGGGVVNAARLPLVGRERVAKALLGIARTFWAEADVRRVTVNGTGGILIARPPQRVAVGTVEVGPDGVRRMWFVVNPEKLERFS